MDDSLVPRAAALPAVLVVLLAFAGRPAGAAQGGPPGGAEAQVDAYSTAAIARAARDLRFGARLQLEGVTLEPAAPPVGLDLERFEVFTPDARIVVHGRDGEEERPAPASAYFRGRVIGEPDSVALLAVHESGRMRGIVRRADGLWELAPEPPRAGRARRLVARRVEAPEADPSIGFECAADELPPAPESFDSAALMSTSDGFESSGLAGTSELELQAATATSHTARVAVETDYELFQRLGTQAATTEYVGDLFAYASTIYDREIATDLQVSHLSLWTTAADPWSQTSTSCGFYEFGRYWNDNRSAVSRTIAHFVSGKSSSAGIAWIGVLCRGGFNVDLGSSCTGLSPRIDNYGGAYGFSSGVRGSFDPDSPSVVWDIVVVSHEIGHNFNSPHTHCYNGLGGSSSPVDECRSGESRSGSACYTGTQRLPGPAGAGSGTLMSYCHLLSPGMSNLSLTFGTGHPYGVLPQRVPDWMRAHVEATAITAPACLARQDGGGGGSCEDLTLSNETVDTTELYEACGTLRAGDGFEVVSPGNVTLRARTVVLGSGFSVGSGSRLRVESE
jgi:hypothetical protein